MGRWAIINAVLAVIVVLLAVEIAGTWARALPPVEVGPGPRAPAAAPEKHEKGKRGAEKSGAHADEAPATLVAAIADKDLFDVTRQKASEEVKGLEQTPAVTGPPANVTIVGVRIFGKDREAFVTEAGAQKRLRTGDQVAGYTVKAIDSGGVTLTSPSGDVVSMPLVVDSKGGTPPKPAVPVRPGMPQPPRQAVTSPAAGVQTTSPAAGFGAKPPTPGVVVPRPPVPGAPPVAQVPQNPENQNPQLQQLPPDVRQKLERMKQNPGNTRSGRGRH